MRSNDSILLISQIGWTPQFFKRPGSRQEQVRIADRVGARRKIHCSCKVCETGSKSFGIEGLPSHYWFGKILQSFLSK